MKGAVGGSDPAPDRLPQSVAFESARVPTRRGRPPLFVLAFVAVLTGVIAVGLGGRAPVVTPTHPPAARASPTRTANATATATATAEASPEGVLTHPTPQPVITTGPGPIQLQVRRNSGSVFVHGDLYPRNVSWVFVSLWDQAGRVVGWTSISVPGAAGPAIGSGPSLRFDVELRMPAEDAGVTLWVGVTVYGSTDGKVASTSLEVKP